MGAECKGKQEDGLSIILPAFNEEANIANAVQDTVGYFKDKTIPYEIIVVNDGSRDRTRQMVEALLSDPHIRLINHERNEGYGYALRDGFNAARYSYLFFTDSDRQFEISGLDTLLPLIRTNVVDLVIGYRLNRQDPLFRRFLAWGYNTIAGFIFDLDVKDIDCAYKMFRAHVFDKIHIQSRNFFVNTEILAKARFFGFTILETGVPHFPRKAGQSTVSAGKIFLTLRELVRIWREIAALRRRK